MYVICEPVRLLFDGPLAISTAGSHCMPARRREAILAPPCMVLHGWRVPGDVVGHDLASICYNACEFAYVTMRLYVRKRV